MSQFKRLDVEVPVIPGVYSLPFPIDNNQGTLVLFIDNNGKTCITYVAQPIQIFEDSSLAIVDDTGPLIDATIADNSNVVSLPRKSRKLVAENL